MSSTRGSGNGRWHSLNPPATAADYRRARAMARALAHGYAREGADAVLLAGSWARGDAHRRSDLDLWVLGRHLGPVVLWRDPYMVSVHRTSEAEERRKLYEPPRVGGSVPGWRVAVPLYDPHGIAARLKREARRFRWEMISRKCDRWVSRQTASWGEEAVKLVRALATGRRETAAVQRNLLVDALGFVMAIHRRTFWDSENEFWERIGRQVGGNWWRAQRRAFGFGAPSIEESCRGALRLYAETVGAVAGVLSAEDARISFATCRWVGERVPGVLAPPEVGRPRSVPSPQEVRRAPRLRRRTPVSRG
ncbi:MAG TPA: nucleotidyltransferase domain-containing protein [Thermoplasmata archaeon]|nr:nucleotidyltransferase domain-containing protein [Thermoplasmata archaeon]